MLRNKIKNSGFTMIELLVVISVIALMSSIVLTSLQTAKFKAYDARRASDIRTIGNALALVYDNDSKFPCHSLETSYDNPDFMNFLVTKGYMSDPPTDPVNDSSYHYEFMTLKRTLTGACGQIAFLGVYANSPIVCPLSGHVWSGLNTHCHIWFPERPPAPCNTQYFYDNEDECPLNDTVNEY